MFSENQRTGRDLFSFILVALSVYTPVHFLRSYSYGIVYDVWSTVSYRYMYIFHTGIYRAVKRKDADAPAPRAEPKQDVYMERSRE